jgi:hypothetical protein
MIRLCWKLALALCAAALAALVSGVIPSPLTPRAGALPLYTARAGRTCDNCHTDPTGWKNPELKKRKCNMSCSGCHINPSGGGLRTVSGRFYGQATLPMFGASHRPFKDWQRHMIHAAAEKTRKNRIPDPAWGTAPGGPAAMAYDQERYAGLHADPLVWVGIDARTALWVAKKMALFFPMQLDTYLAVRPYRHLTAYVSGGVLAKSQGYVTTFGLGCRPEEPNADCYSRSRSTPFMVKDTFLMLHQLPYMSYVRAGRFEPPFGLMLPDHTIPTRRHFELDHGILHSRVTGVEVGLAPNYPYFQLAFFRPNRQDRFTDDPERTSPDELPPFFGVSGWGSAASFGWRDLGYQFGLSAMVRQREHSDGGDTQSLSFNVGFNPWYYLDWLPLTYTAELAFGSRQRVGSGAFTGQIALVQELDYLAFNGLNFRLRHDYADFDVEVRGDHINRLALGFDLIALPGLGLSGESRLTLAGEDPGSVEIDGIFYLRAWY